jgi:hypothetical protein
LFILSGIRAKNKGQNSYRVRTKTPHGNEHSRTPPIADYLLKQKNLAQACPPLVSWRSCHWGVANLSLPKGVRVNILGSQTSHGASGNRDRLDPG